MKYSLALLILLSTLSKIYGAAQVDFCYVIEERSGNLYRVAQDGSQQAKIGQIAECNVEAIAWNRIDELWMFDAETSAFYTLDVGTGTSTFKFTAPSLMRSDDGTVHQIKDVDALDFDAFNSDILWCVERIEGGEDLLFSLDVTTGQVVGNIGYPVTGVGQDIDDIGIDPLTGTMYAVSSTNGEGDQLIVIDTLSGAGFVIGNLLEGGVQVNNMEGFGFDVDGQLIGTTGRDGNPIKGALYHINKGTGAVTLLTVIDSINDDIESIACFNSRIELGAISDVSALTRVDRNCPGECPVLSLSDGFISPILNIINKECTAIDGTSIEGSIDVEGNCPGGSILEYRVGDGAWGLEEPTYNDQMAEMISIRCRCDVAEGVLSDAVVQTTNPAPPLDDASFSYASTVFCLSMEDPSPDIMGLSGGSFTATPDGLGINDTTGEIDISTSAEGNYVISYMTTGTCPQSSSFNIEIVDEISCENAQISSLISFRDPCDCDHPLNCFSEAIDDYYFADTLTIPASGSISSGLDIRITASSDFYIHVACLEQDYTEPIYGMMTGTLIPEVSPGVYQLAFWRTDELPTTLSISADNGMSLDVPTSVFDSTCDCERPMLNSIPTMGEWGLICLGLLLLILVNVSIKDRAFDAKTM